MTGLLGVVLVGVAAAGAVLTLRNWTLWNALRRVRPTTPDRLVQVAASGRYDGRVVAVFGVATAGPGGGLHSTVNDETCVWHRHVVHRRRVSYRQTERGRVQQYSRRRQVAEFASVEPFLLRGLVPQPARASRLFGGTARAGTAVMTPPMPGLSGVVGIAPAGMRVHRPAFGGVRILPALAAEPFPRPGELAGQYAQLYWHREWVLRAGVPLFVLGELTRTGPGLTLGRPRKGPHVISTRTARSLRRRTTVSVLGGLALATSAVVAGVVLLLLLLVG